MFAMVGLLDRVEFEIVRSHRHNCEQGIYESHLSCIKKGVFSGAKNILIFEDDIFFDRFDPLKLKRCVTFLENSDWDIFFLGCLVRKSMKTSNPYVVKICYRTLAHAYVINRPFAIQLMNYPYQQTAFDDMLANLDGTYYAIYPSFAFQDDSVSDNTVHLNLDTFRRLCGGLIRIQKRNEFYHRHRMLIIFLHCLFIFFIVVIAFV